MGYLMRVSAMDEWIYSVIPEPSVALMGIVTLTIFIGRRRRETVF